MITTTYTHRRLLRNHNSRVEKFSCRSFARALFFGHKHKRVLNCIHSVPRDPRRVTLRYAHLPSKALPKTFPPPTSTMGFGLITLAPVGLGRVTKQSGRVADSMARRSSADFRRFANPRVGVSLGRTRVTAVSRRTAIVPFASSKIMLQTVTYTFNEDGSSSMDPLLLGTTPTQSAVTCLESEGAETAGDLVTSGMTASTTTNAAPNTTQSHDLGRLSFQPSRAVASVASAEAQAATAGPAQGQTDESAMAAFTADDMLCMLYGVDQDKEDAKYKVAFFDLDAVCATGALRNAVTELRQGKVGDGGDSESSDKKPVAENKTKTVPTWLQTLWRPIATLFAFLAASLVSVESGSSNSNTSRSANQTSLTHPDSFDVFAGMASDASSTSALAQKIYQTHLAFGVFPEAVRFAKQLRYDGYKVVVVTSAPSFMAKQVGDELGASRVLGTELEIDADNATFTGRAALDASESGESSIHRSIAEIKTLKIRQFATDKNVSLSRSLCYGRFGETSLELMETTGKAYAVSPDLEMAAAAKEKGKYFHLPHSAD